MIWLSFLMATQPKAVVSDLPVLEREYDIPIGSLFGGELFAHGIYTQYRDGTSRVEVQLVEDGKGYSGQVFKYKRPQHDPAAVIERKGRALARYNSTDYEELFSK